jgi:hypothetical protein
MEFSSYVTGFADGEGCFTVSFTKRAKLKTGIEVRPSFSISQNQRSKDTLDEIRKFFGCGGVRYSRGDNTYKYEVRSINDLREIIIPHFDKYPLRTSKKQDFQIFRKICQLVSEGKHQENRYLKEIIESAYQMNGLGRRKHNKDELLRLLVR